MSSLHSTTHYPPKPDSETVRNFLIRNDGHYPESSLTEELRKVVGRDPLNPHIPFKKPHVLISDASIDKFFDKEVDEGWFLSRAMDLLQTGRGGDLHSSW